MSKEGDVSLKIAVVAPGSLRATGLGFLFIRKSLNRFKAKVPLDCNCKCSVMITLEVFVGLWKTQVCMLAIANEKELGITFLFFSGAVLRKLTEQTY